MGRHLQIDQSLMLFNMIIYHPTHPGKTHTALLQENTTATSGLEVKSLSMSSKRLNTRLAILTSALSVLQAIGNNAAFKLGNNLLKKKKCFRK